MYYIIIILYQEPVKTLHFLLAPVYIFSAYVCSIFSITLECVVLYPESTCMCIVLFLVSYLYSYSSISSINLHVYCSIFSIILEMYCSIFSINLYIYCSIFSTITSWTKDGEVEAYRNMLTKV